MGRRDREDRFKRLMRERVWYRRDVHGCHEESGRTE